MRVAVAGAVTMLVVVAAGCSRHERPADDGLGAGAGMSDTTIVRDTLMAPGLPDTVHVLRDSTMRDSTYPPR